MMAAMMKSGIEAKESSYSTESVGHMLYQFVPLESRCRRHAVFQQGQKRSRGGGGSRNPTHPFFLTIKTAFLSPFSSNIT